MIILSLFKIFDSIFDSIFNSVIDSIFDSGSSNSTPIHQFYYSASTRLRSPTFSIRLDDESRVGTPLRRYLIPIIRQLTTYLRYPGLTLLKPYHTNKPYRPLSHTLKPHKCRSTDFYEMDFRCLLWCRFNKNLHVIVL